MRALPGAALAALLCLTPLAGCGGTDQVEVEGTVTYDGQPIQAGSIAFLATGEGFSTGGAIVDGKYHIPAEHGPKVGKYRVEIRWAKPTGKKFKTEAGELLDDAKEGLPPKYNNDSELTADVTSGKNTINFDLKK